MRLATTPLPRQLSQRLLRIAPRAAPFSTSRVCNSDAPAYTSGPAPPRLPKEDQELFERLQKASSGAFSLPKGEPSVTPTSSSTSPTSTASASPLLAAGARMTVNQSPDGEDSPMHQDIRRGAKPEFEGEVNPKTGEVGGPKNEPLRWGAQGDWSFNGRVTDF